MMVAKGRPLADDVVVDVATTNILVRLSVELVVPYQRLQRSIDTLEMAELVPPPPLVDDVQSVLANISEHFSVVNIEFDIRVVRHYFLNFLRRHIVRRPIFALD